MITAIRYINFKRYKEVSVDVSKPITILVGPNSSGKSSLIKGLLAFKQTYEDPTDHAGFVPQGAYVDIGHFEEYVSDHDIDKDVTFVFEVPFPPRPFFTRIDGVDFTRVFIEVSHEEDPQTKHGRVSSYRVFVPETPLTTISNYNASDYWISYTRMQKSEEAFKISLSQHLFAIFADRFRRGPHSSDPVELANSYARLRNLLEKGSIQASRNNQRGMSTHFNRANFTSELDILSSMERLLVQNAHSALFNNLTSDTFALAGLREKASRSSKRTDENRVVGSSGANTASVYFSLRQKAKKSGRRETKTGEDFAELERWFAYLRLGDKIEISGWRDLIDMRTANSDRKNISDSIVDVGVGFSQSAPILVQLAAMPESTLLILEQPELHLYPWAQTKLGVLFCQEAFRRKKRLVIETHSEHLIHGIQLHISESRTHNNVGLTADDVQILYVDEKARISEMKLNEYGEFVDDWPEGFFDQTLSVYRQILNNKVS
ncbi:DUF3696 domain-containing protein [Mesorhizobium caraganae]|uniref:DUF3696 domain-containing protein n=1 Tax=Mesorhizobium caraganae TaxID=483206 RepID=UPI003ECD8BE0